TYNGVLIATAGGPVKTVEDIKGKSFGFGDQASTSSHLIPRAFLAKRGLIAGKDYQAVHVGTHDAVARAVQNGQLPAGGLSKAILDNLISRNTVDKTKIVEIGISDPIPNYPMVMQGNLTPALKDAIRKAFIEMKDEAVLKAFRVQGFAATDDKAYDVLRDTAKVLDLDLTKVRG
ncbi:MAG: phosphate/phosphite/phosphonate ABC transporter substrate-binding protein, partial [Beijerinckiaceae bacterium]